MDRIPPEILCDVFLAALPHPTDRREYISSVLAPMRISHVCRTWRALSLSFGELWSYLCLEYGLWRRYLATGERRKDLKTMVSVFDTWIERTNGAPLNFRVEFHCDSFELTTIHRDIAHVVTTMISQQHRWRDIKLKCGAVKFFTDLIELDYTNMPARTFSEMDVEWPLTNMPLLTSLELDVEWPLDPRINIAQSPNLRRLHISAPGLQVFTGWEPLCSFNESAEIIIRSNGSEGDEALREWLNVLKAAPFLTEFIADSQRCTDPPLRGQNDNLIRLPNLHILKLMRRDDDFDPAAFIVDYVTLPNLQVLFFASSQFDTDMKMEILTSFIRRSLPPLTTLVMDLVDVHEGLVVPVLRLLPTLKYLRLFRVNGTKHFFQELTVPNNTDANNLQGDEDAAVCPVLETLFLQWVSLEEDADSWAAFIAMLRSRPGRLGKSDVIYLRRGNKVSATVDLSDLGENIGSSRREVREHVWNDGVVIGNHEIVESLLIRGTWQISPVHNCRSRTIAITGPSFNA